MLKVDITNQCQEHRVPSDVLCKEWINATLDFLDKDSNCSVSLQFLSPEDSQALNQQYRDKDYPTNVLSFPANLPQEIVENLDASPLGDLAICPAVVEEEARAQNKEVEAHWAHLTIHGCLHLLGFEHEGEDEAAEMENIEIEVLKKFGISNPYLIG